MRQRRKTHIEMNLTEERDLGEHTFHSSNKLMLFFREEMKIKIRRKECFFLMIVNKTNGWIFFIRSVLGIDKCDFYCEIKNQHGKSIHHKKKKLKSRSKEAYLFFRRMNDLDVLIFNLEQNFQRRFSSFFHRTKKILFSYKSLAFIVQGFEHS